ncbi:site-specific integrase [Ruminiclostridium cellobioparum]|uniref:site-specific integrase n=1 Tax=Ruminiclostridium cellobioparum TaxID=29355 RepID=UPI0009FCBC37
MFLGKAVLKNLQKQIQATGKLLCLTMLSLCSKSIIPGKTKSNINWVICGKAATSFSHRPTVLLYSPSRPTVWFHAFLKRHNLPPITFHQLRHTNASLLVSLGVDITTVSKRLGHSRTSTTLDIYAHSLKSRDEEAASRLENLLFVDKEADKETPQK